MGVGGVCFSFRFEFAVEVVNTRVDLPGPFARFEFGDFGADVFGALVGVLGVFCAVSSVRRGQTERRSKAIKQREHEQDDCANARK